MAQRKMERRKSQRFKTPLEIEFRTLTHNPIYGSVTSEDVSKEGVSFANKKEVKKGTNVELRMNVPGDNVPIFATGRVTWHEVNKTGVRITKIAKGDQTKIFEYIYREWLKKRSRTNDQIRRNNGG